METPTLQQVLDVTEELWPASLAESWDAVGLVAGRRDRPVRTIHFAVDPVAAVVDEACEAEADLLITHHPLLLRGVTTVEAGTFKGEVIHRLIESGCALLSAHTNGDSAVGGVNDVLAEILGLENTQPLKPAEDGLDEEGLGRIGTLPQGTTFGEFAATVFGVLPAVAGECAPPETGMPSCTGWRCAEARGTRCSQLPGTRTPMSTSLRTCATIQPPRLGRPQAANAPSCWTSHTLPVSGCGCRRLRRV